MANNQILKKLNAKHRKFLRKVWNGEPHGEAYMSIWKTNNPITARPQSTNILKSPVAIAYLAKLDERVEASDILSKREMLERLFEMIEEGATDARILASMQEFSKLAGYYAPQKLDVAVKTIKVERV